MEVYIKYVYRYWLCSQNEDGIKNLGTDVCDKGLLVYLIARLMGELCPVLGFIGKSILVSSPKSLSHGSQSASY